MEDKQNGSVEEDREAQPVEVKPLYRPQINAGCLVMLPTADGYSQCCRLLVWNGFFCQEHS